MSRPLRIASATVGIITILFAISMTFQFISHILTADYRYNVEPNFERIDDRIEITNYDVKSEETKELYSLEDSQVNALMFTGLSLSILSVIYVLITFLGKTKSASQLNSLDQENEVLKKQIENNELKQRLKGFTPNDSKATESNSIF